MSSDILFKLEKIAYPTGSISSSGQNLSLLTSDESSYTPPVDLSGSVQALQPIVVPTHNNILKNRKNILRIMRLVEQRHNSLLILLCSEKATKKDARYLAERFPDLNWVAIDGPFPYSYGTQKLKTTYSPLSHGKSRDIAQKRNFALQLARHMHWESIFFLDDDVSISNQQLDKAFTLLKSPKVSVVGFNARFFPDHSVAMHAHKWLRNSLDSFIGTGAIAVKINTPFLSFFPHIYNEDFWNAEINSRLAYLHGLQNDLGPTTLFHPLRKYQTQRALTHATERILSRKGGVGLTGKDLAQWVKAWCQDIDYWNKLPTPSHPCKDIPEVLASLGCENEFESSTDIERLLRRPTPAMTPKPTSIKTIPARYEGAITAPRTHSELEGLHLTQTIQTYFSQNNLRMEKVVASANMLRFDRPTHWISDIKPRLTVSMVINYGESLAQVRSSVQKIIKWSQVCGPTQLLIWVYSDSSRSASHLNGFRNQIVTQIMHDVAGTHVQLRSGLITQKRQAIVGVINAMLDDISFAYWKQHIPAQHPIFIVNSCNKVLRTGTFHQFMQEEPQLPQLLLGPSLKKLALKAPPGHDTAVYEDQTSLQAARSRLISPPSSKILPIAASIAARRMVYHMKKAGLTWVQLDDMAFNIIFHDPAGEESIEHIKTAMCIPVNYAEDLPGDKQKRTDAITRLIAKAKPGCSFLIIVHGDTAASWKEIDSYRKELMKLVTTHAKKNAILLSAAHRPTSTESAQLLKRRNLLLTEYAHWLQNHERPINLRWIAANRLY